MEDGSPKCVMEAKKRDSPTSGQPAKRLKQACLQFKNVGVRSIGDCSPKKSARKRPLSCSEDDVKNTTKRETDDLVQQNARNNKSLGTCKENHGPSRSKNKSDTFKKNKSNKKLTPELKFPDSSSTKNDDEQVMLVDLSLDSGDELDADSENAKHSEHAVNDPTIITLDVDNDKINKTQSSTEEVENETHAANVSKKEIQKRSVTPTKSPRCETDDHLNSCIENVILNTSNEDNNKTVADVNNESTKSGESPNTSTSQSDHIDECIESVIKTSSSFESGSVSASGETVQQNVPVHKKKKLTKVARSTSEILAKELEIQEKLKIQLETAKLRAELKRQREEAKQQREREKAEALAKKKKDELEKLERLHLKEEERKKKEGALQAKSEEKLKKAKEKQERDDEKKKADEEEQRKKNKVKAAFVSFFVKKDPAQPILEPENVASFRSTDNVQQAPLHRNCRSNSSELVKALDFALEEQMCSTLYLEQVKKKEIVPGKSKKLPTVVDKDVEIITSSGEVDCPKKGVCKAKLLQFSENVRPPYWGTWRKRSKVIRSRTPFVKDEKYFDYEVDSEAEWEEEEPGESLSNSEGEKESDDDYEVDNEFFVPHGYLSEEEDQDGAEMSPDDFKEQLKLKQKEFEIERKRKCQQMKPSLLGCFWMADNQSGNEEVIKVLEEYSAVLLTVGSIDTQYSNWLSASVNLPHKTPSPNSIIVESSPPSLQNKCDKSIIQRLHFTPKTAKAVRKNVGVSPVIDLTDDELSVKPLTPGNG